MIADEPNAEKHKMARQYHSELLRYTNPGYIMDKLQCEIRTIRCTLHNQVALKDESFSQI